MAAELSKEEPLSPASEAYINNYTPSKESQEAQDFFGRRGLRIMNGQDPVKQPEKFTPRVNLLSYRWPTDEEVQLWAEAKPWENKATWSCNSKPNKRQKKLELPKTPAEDGGTTSTPITEDMADAAASSSFAGPPVPFQL